MFEIEDYANTQARNAQIIQHQPTFVVGDLVDDLCVYDYRIKRDQVRNEETEGCCRNGIFRTKNSTTSAFSYGFSTRP